MSLYNPCNVGILSIDGEERLDAPGLIVDSELLVTLWLNPDMDGIAKFVRNANAGIVRWAFKYWFFKWAKSAIAYLCRC